MARAKWNIETVRTRLKEISPNIDVLETEYKNNETKMKCLCAIHNHEFHTAWAQLQAGHGCPICGGSAPLNMEIVKERLSKINENIEILDTEYVKLSHKMKCRCKIDGHEWFAHAGNLLHNNRGCPRCAKNERIDTEKALIRLANETSNITFGEFEYKNQFTRIPCKCDIDGYEWSPIFNSLVRGSGCPVCANKSVATGINDIATTRPELVKYFKHESDAKSNTCGSNFKVDMICPDCWQERKFSLAQLSRQGFACSVCGDGISRNNKIMINMFKQLGIELITEYKIKGYRFSYDGKFEVGSKQYLLEIQGSQHYRYSGRGRGLEFEIENDKNKKKVAIDNGYVYIDVDCNKFDYNYIKDNFTKSLSNIIDLQHINWDECFEFSYKSLVATACKLRQDSNNTMTTTQIADCLGLTNATISTYLKLGNKLGLCEYVTTQEAKRIQLENMSKPSMIKAKKVVQLTLEGEYIETYDSMMDAYQKTGVGQSGICSCCKGTKAYANGYRWMYYSDYKKE
jgi:predicted transcriptional regulator